jgi:CRISPR-associated endonuclease Csn1
VIVTEFAMTSKPITIGLDIGIASVGWAVLEPNRIVALGVRAFDKAETAKEGESLNLARRTARLTRRRLRRRSQRLRKLARTLKRAGVIYDATLFQSQQSFGASLWKLRVDGLDRQLEAEEWARVIYHICKHRGFHWFSRAEEKQAAEDKKGDGGKVKQGLAVTAGLMREKGYRTAAEMVLKEYVKQKVDAEGNLVFDQKKEPIPLDAARNKHGDYGKALSRVLLSEELARLFERQRELGNPRAGKHLET